MWYHSGALQFENVELAPPPPPPISQGVKLNKGINFPYNTKNYIFSLEPF